MAATRIFSIIGQKGSGKTTLAVALAAEYIRRGQRVMTMKHAHHPVFVDQEGTDSFRHFTEGKAERVVLAAPKTRIIFEHSQDDVDPMTLASRYLDGADIVLAEGFTASALPKIEVYRKAVSDSPIYNPDTPEAANWIAILTDDDALDAECIVLRFRDTMWLQLLANLAWDGAKVLNP